MLGALDSPLLCNCCCDGGGQINLTVVTFVFYLTSFQNQPIVPPWSSQAVLKLEHKNSQVREHLNTEIIMYYHPHHHDRHIESQIHVTQSHEHDYQIPNVLMESPEEMEEVLADLRRNAEARAKTMARYQDFLTFEV